MNKKQTIEYLRGLGVEVKVEPETGHINLERQDLRDLDLQHLDLTKANLRFANLCGANLTGVWLGGADVFGAFFDQDTIISEQVLFQSFGFFSQMSYVSGQPGPKVTRSRTIEILNRYGVLAPLLKDDEINLDRENCPQGLASKSLRGLCLAGARIWGVDMSGSDLKEVFARQASFSFVKLNGSDLRGANFSGAELHNVYFHQADLRGVDFSGANLYASDFRQAKMKGINLQGADYNEETSWPPNFNPVKAGANPFLSDEGLANLVKFLA